MPPAFAIVSRRETIMRNVLIVDDEEGFTLTLSEGFKAYSMDFTMLAAGNGKEAVKILKSAKIDLVVTDLKMPEMDGFELLAYMSANHPTIPVIVMTAFGNSKIEKRLEALGIGQFLEKPLDFEVLIERIYEELAAGATGYIRGITLATFAQMVEIEKKTYTLKIRTPEKEGYLYFNQGTLLDAETESRNGFEAALEIVSWSNAEIEISSGCRKKQNNINVPLPHILMEGYRIKDEKEGDPEQGVTKGGPAARENVGSDGLPLREDGAVAQGLKEEDIVALQNRLKEFATVDGFVGVGLFTPLGDLLAMVASEEANLGEIGIYFNHLLINAQRAALQTGAGTGRLLHLECDKANVIARCLNEGSGLEASEPGKAHVHLILVLTPEGNLGMAKMKVSSVITFLGDTVKASAVAD
jgi:CheY-like chemotaxis protein